jgi:hypothetical protein
MTLTKQGNFTFSHAAQQNDLYNVYSATQIKQHFDSRADELKTTINAIIDQLQAITDGDSGADNVKATAVLDLTGSTVQALIESIRDTLKSTTDGASGADFVNSTLISGVTGSTVQAQLESLKTLIDAVYTKAQLDGGQLDNRYFTEVEIQSTTDTNSGADKVGATEVAAGSGTTVQLILEWLYQEIVNVTLGQIPDGSLTDIKLSNDPADIKARFMDFLGNANVQTVAIPHGLSIIETDQKSPLDIKADGRTLVNHMGWQGDFRSQFNRWDANLAIDTSVYKFGTSSGKIDNSAGTAEKFAPNSQKIYLTGKYVLVGVWAKSVSGTPEIDVLTLGRDSAGTLLVGEGHTLRKIIDNTWKFYYIKLDYTAKTADHWNVRLDVNTHGTADDVVNFDGMVVYELTQAEFDRVHTQAEIEEEYAYIDSVKHIQSPVVVSYGKNLLPSFDEWTLHANAKVIEPYKLELNATNTNDASYYEFEVVQNTDYAVNLSTGQYAIANTSGNTTGLLGYGTGARTFNSGSNSKLRIYISNAGLGTGTFTFTNPQLELGSVATTFEVQNKTYLYGKDIKLGSNLDGSVADQLIDRNSMLKRFELDEVLDGSKPFAFISDHAGYKLVQVTVDRDIDTSKITYPVKYDGKNLRHRGTRTEIIGADEVNVAGAKVVDISIADTDSGWTDAMTPIANFIKGYFNGWKYTGDGTTHSWAQINDATVTSTSDTFVADPANSHADWTPYELSYQLADAVVEPVTMEGALSLIEGLNTVEFVEGVIPRELANPVLSGGYYYINYKSIASSFLKHRTEKIINIYKDGDLDTANWTISSSSNANGNEFMYILESDFDTTAQYTVTYLVLDKHLFTANGVEAEGTYNTNLKTVVDKHTDQIADLNTKQSIQDIWNIDVGVTGDKLKVQVGNASASVAVTFDQAFSAVPRIYPSDVTAKTATGFTMNASGGDWIAIGNK